MSSFAVKVEQIVSVEPHPNADRLELAQVLDWRCVVGKGQFRAGDLCIYFPIDSILPEAVESAIFGPDSKIQLSKHRVKTIKLRGAISQGLAVTPFTLNGPLTVSDVINLDVGDDLTTALGVTKYEPQISGGILSTKGNAAPRKYLNPNFKKYTDLENAKNYPNVFSPDEIVVVTEKIHGTNFRAGYVPTVANTFFKKIKKFFRILPEYEFAYGSRNIQLQDRSKGHKTWYQTHDILGGNVYEEIVAQYDLMNVIPKGYVIYGEIYGVGIQKGYTYGVEEHDPHPHKLTVFDVMHNGKFLGEGEFIGFVVPHGLPHVPMIYKGEFKSTEFMKSLTVGPSALDSSQKVREGIVVKPVVEATHHMLGRKVLKYVSDEYLLKDQTEFH